MTITVPAARAGRAATTLPIGAALPSLVRWGASADADLVYRTLVTFGPRTRRDLGLELAMPVRRIDDALAELRSAGAVTAGEAVRSRTWAAVPPDVVVAALRTRRLSLADERALAESHRRIVGDLRTRLGALALPLSAPVLGGLQDEQVRYLPTRHLTRARYAELLPGRQETLTINPEQAFDAESARTGAELDRRLIAQGTRMRVLGVPPADRDTLNPQERPHPAYRIRESLRVPLKLIVLDRAVALLPADPERIERGYLEIGHPGVVSALAELFERHWEVAADPYVGAVTPIVLTSREQALVDLLALGHTDVTAAGQLRISARSVTNTLRRLMDHLGVENRFQLGLALGAMNAARPPQLSTSEQDRT
ncbi:LuxR C-terminal-related transcriptional regulator [Actinoplanes aureus]|uniref:LuxR C-terminal-related transcriptional regulator n=1 Tax=Actinoplanes aureus TaxID=2792083 RepID=UPI0028161950|nr:LuxR C-terminal-related transcriptional regulator [Actinoplanes aureus]